MIVFFSIVIGTFLFNLIISGFDIRHALDMVKALFLSILVYGTIALIALKIIKNILVVIFGLWIISYKLLSWLGAIVALGYLLYYIF